MISSTEDKNIVLERKKNHSGLCDSAVKSFYIVLAMQTPKSSLSKIEIYLYWWVLEKRGDGKREETGVG